MIKLATILVEAIQSQHYKERKAERGIILGVKLPKEAYGEYGVEETNNKLVTILQAELDRRFTDIESRDFLLSDKYNLGLGFFIPVLQNKDKRYKINMETQAQARGKGYMYLAILANNTLVTTYVTDVTSAEEVEKLIQQHTERNNIETGRKPKAYFPQNATFIVDIDELYGKKEKPAEYRVSQEDLDYKVRTDYRTGAQFDHKTFGKGKIVDTSSGSKGIGDSRGIVAWVDVKFDKPYMKGGKLEYIRRFNNVFTTIYFKKSSSD